MKDHYKTLGVERNASKDDIKKAFRVKAHQYHPDKNKNDPAAAQKFKEASEAYSILSDDNKRAQYDRFGDAGVNMGGGASGFNGGQGFGGFDFSGFQNGANGFEFDLGDIFGDIFGGGGGRGGRAKTPRGDDLTVDVTLSFEESIFGVEKDIFIKKPSKCLTCEGSGAAKGTKKKKCKTCDGRGRVQEMKRSFLGAFATTRVCETCHGAGEVPEEKCSTCHGTGVTNREQEITVSIPAGIENGQAVRLAGAGEAVPFGVSGDLYIRVRVKPHASIQKEGSNLRANLGIKLTEAIEGATMSFDSLDGPIEVEIPEGTNTGDILRIKGKGVPQGHGKRGDLMLHVRVAIPKKLSKESKRLIEELKRQGL